MAFGFNEDFTKHPIDGLQGIQTQISASSSTDATYWTGTTPKTNSRYVLDGYRDFGAEYMPSEPSPDYNFHIVQRYSHLTTARPAGIFTFIYNGRNDAPAQEVDIIWNNPNFQLSDYDVICVYVWYDGLNWRADISGYDES